MRAEDLLPDVQNHLQFSNGATIRKGTVGAFLANAKVWSDPATGSAQRLAAEHDIVEALPALRALGLFDVLSVQDSALQRLIEAR